ncbi:MAG TPA: sensor domain-containing diguanylate cyclase [Pyrinomonadaceae bacterium]|nr:sensor domain-containing diguanylate cyclase [Pyrinomonadaceae bacterium]
MEFKEASASHGAAGGPSTRVYTALAVIGLAAPTVTFLIAVSGLDPRTKIYGLATTSLVYFAICFWSFRRLRSESFRSSLNRGDHAGEVDLNGKLLALEEANEFFGTSLQPADTFRLVSSRIREIYPFTASVLFIIDAGGSNLHATHADGGDDRLLPGSAIEKGRGIAGLAVLSGDVEFASDLKAERELFTPKALDGLRSAAAIPLSYKDEVFGVIQLFSETKLPVDGRSREVLAAVAERVGPLLRGSMAFERSLSNALTDPLTSLPNERAFFMILENQLAESIRFREERPLSVISLDIKGFDESDNGGDAGEGERLLSFVGDIVQGQLRKMDFLARSISDEFLIILPTASESTAKEIVNRIQIAFAQTPFKTGDGDDIKVWLNFGSSCFWKDGENANQLLQSARLRRQQAKSQDPDKVLWFNKEYLN